LNGQFEGRRVEKLYHALVTGNPAWQEHTAALPLRSNAGRRHRTVVDPEGGKPAETLFRVLDRFEGAALVEAAPKTGRTHQIRVHLRALEHPILGDPLYTLPDAPAPAPLPIERLGLHAWSLAFDHPVTGERLRLQAPYPADFSAALDKLRGRSAYLHPTPLSETRSMAWLAHPITHSIVNPISENPRPPGGFLDVPYPPWYHRIWSFSTLPTRVLKYWTINCRVSRYSLPLPL
jgi:hypothetical protein